MEEFFSIFREIHGNDEIRDLFLPACDKWIRKLKINVDLLQQALHEYVNMYKEPHPLHNLIFFISFLYLLLSFSTKSLTPLLFGILSPVFLSIVLTLLRYVYWNISLAKNCIINTSLNAKSSSEKGKFLPDVVNLLLCDIKDTRIVTMEDLSAAFLMKTEKTNTTNNKRLSYSLVIKSFFVNLKLNTKEQSITFIITAWLLVETFKVTEEVLFLLCLNLLVVLMVVLLYHDIVKLKSVIVKIKECTGLLEAETALFLKWFESSEILQTFCKDNLLLFEKLKKFQFSQNTESVVCTQDNLLTCIMAFRIAKNMYDKKENLTKAISEENCSIVCKNASNDCGVHDSNCKNSLNVRNPSDFKSSIIVKCDHKPETNSCATNEFDYEQFNENTCENSAGMINDNCIETKEKQSHRIVDGLWKTGLPINDDSVSDISILKARQKLSSWRATRSRCNTSKNIQCTEDGYASCETTFSKETPFLLNERKAKRFKHKHQRSRASDNCENYHNKNQLEMYGAGTKVPNGYIDSFTPSKKERDCNNDNHNIKSKSKGFWSNENRNEDFKGREGCNEEGRETNSVNIAPTFNAIEKSPKISRRKIKSTNSSLGESEHHMESHRLPPYDETVNQDSSSSSLTINSSKDQNFQFHDESLFDSGEMNDQELNPQQDNTCCETYNKQSYEQFHNGGFKIRKEVPPVMVTGKFKYGKLNIAFSHPRDEDFTLKFFQDSDNDDMDMLDVRDSYGTDIPETFSSQACTTTVRQSNFNQNNPCLVSHHNPFMTDENNQIFGNNFQKNDNRSTQEETDEIKDSGLKFHDDPDCSDILIVPEKVIDFGTPFELPSNDCTSPIKSTCYFNADNINFSYEPKFKNRATKFEYKRRFSGKYLLFKSRLKRLKLKLNTTPNYEQDYEGYQEREPECS